MTDSIDQAVLTEETFFIDTVPKDAEVDRTVDDIGGTGSPDEVGFGGGGDLARSPDILSRLAVDLELAG